MTFPPPLPAGTLHGLGTPATAAILIIGNEILSGKTKDANTPWIAERLKARGVRLLEVRVVPDIEDAIVTAVNALRHKYDFVFTTGGIGPTHDDITAECISKAFGLAHAVHPDAHAKMAESFAARGVEFNAARLRMATMPEGATLVYDPASVAPGFKIGNVFVMAGIPSVMHGMWTNVEPYLPHAPEFKSQSVVCRLKEGDIAEELGNIQKKYPDVEIGSYPSAAEDGGFQVTLVLTCSDEDLLAQATAAVQDMVKRLS